MSYIRLLWISSILFASLNMSSQGVTIDETVDYALSNSYELRQSQLAVAEADARIKETWAIGLPKLNGNINYQYFPDVPNFLIPAQFADPDAPEGSFISLPAGTQQSLNASLDFSALLFDGSFFVGLRASKVFKDLTQKEVAATRHEVKWNVKRAFYSALLVKEQIDELDRNIRNIEQLLSETRALYEEGFAELLDVRRLELNFNNLNTRKDQMTGMDSVTINLLKLQMAWPMEEPLEISGNLDEMATEWMVKKSDLDFSYTERPDYRVMEVTEELNEINIRQIQMGYFPTVTAVASHVQNLQRDDLFNSDEIGWLKTTNVGARINIPIFDGFDKRARIQRARIDKEKVVEGKNQLRQAIDTEVQNSHLQYQNAKKALSNAQSTLDLSEEIYETVLIKFREGLGTSFELIQSEQDLFEARSQYLNALYDILETRAQLEQSMGR